MVRTRKNKLGRRNMYIYIYIYIGGGCWLLLGVGDCWSGEQAWRGDGGCPGIKTRTERYTGRGSLRATRMGCVGVWV